MSCYQVRPAPRTTPPSRSDSGPASIFSGSWPSFMRRFTFVSNGTHPDVFHNAHCMIIGRGTPSDSFGRKVRLPHVGACYTLTTNAGAEVSSWATSSAASAIRATIDRLLKHVLRTAPKPRSEVASSSSEFNRPSLGVRRSSGSFVSLSRDDASKTEVVDRLGGTVYNRLARARV